MRTSVGRGHLLFIYVGVCRSPRRAFGWARVLYHGGTLEGKAPGDDAHAGGQAHGRQHLGAEHAAVADFSPALEVRVIAKDLKGGRGWLQGQWCGL